MPNERICMVPGCGRALRGRAESKGNDCRGMCGSCYSAASRMVKQGRVTWDELIKAGLAAEAWDIRDTPFRRALRERLGK